MVRPKIDIKESQSYTPIILKLAEYNLKKEMCPGSDYITFNTKNLLQSLKESGINISQSALSQLLKKLLENKSIFWDGVRKKYNQRSYFLDNDILLEQFGSYLNKKFIDKFNDYKKNLSITAILHSSKATKEKQIIKEIDFLKKGLSKFDSKEILAKLKHIDTLYSSINFKEKHIIEIILNWIFRFQKLNYKLSQKDMQDFRRFLSDIRSSTSKTPDISLHEWSIEQIRLWEERRERFEANELDRIIRSNKHVRQLVLLCLNVFEQYHLYNQLTLKKCFEMLSLSMVPAIELEDSKFNEIKKKLKDKDKNNEEKDFLLFIEFLQYFQYLSQLEVHFLVRTEIKIKELLGGKSVFPFKEEN